MSIARQGKPRYRKHATKWERTSLQQLVSRTIIDKTGLTVEKPTILKFAQWFCHWCEEVLWNSVTLWQRKLKLRSSILIPLILWHASILSSGHGGKCQNLQPVDSSLSLSLFSVVVTQERLRERRRNNNNKSLLPLFLSRFPLFPLRAADLSLSSIVVASHRIGAPRGRISLHLGPLQPHACNGGSCDYFPSRSREHVGSTSNRSARIHGFADIHIMKMIHGYQGLSLDLDKIQSKPTTSFAFLSNADELSCLFFRQLYYSKKIFWKRDLNGSVKRTRAHTRRRNEETTTFSHPSLSFSRKNFLGQRRSDAIQSCD